MRTEGVRLVEITGVLPFQKDVKFNLVVTVRRRESKSNSGLSLQSENRSKANVYKKIVSLSGWLGSVKVRRKVGESGQEA